MNGNCNQKQWLTVFVINEGGICWRVFLASRKNTSIDSIYWQWGKNQIALLWAVNVKVCVSAAGPWVRRRPADTVVLQSSPEHGSFQDISDVTVIVNLFIHLFLKKEHHATHLQYSLFPWDGTKSLTLRVKATKSCICKNREGLISKVFALYWRECPLET